MFTASDKNSTSNAAVVQIHIAPVNDIPETGSQLLETSMSESIEISLNALDKDQDTLDIYLNTLPEHGQLLCMGYTVDTLLNKLLDSPYIVYLPDPLFIGVDSFTYYADDGQLQSSISEIQIQIGGASIQTPEDTPIDLTQILTDKTIVKWPFKGTLTVKETFIYTPNANYNGYDTLTYIHEEQEKVMSLYISPVNDPPTIKALPTIELNEDMPKHITIVANDVDGDELHVNISEPDHGKISGSLPVYLYYPDNNYNGLDQVMIAVSDRSETTQMAIMLTIEKAINSHCIIYSGLYTICIRDRSGRSKN